MALVRDLAPGVPKGGSEDETRILVDPKGFDAARITPNIAGSPIRPMQCYHRHTTSAGFSAQLSRRPFHSHMLTAEHGVDHVQHPLHYQPR
jgi:hypothetical protein